MKVQGQTVLNIVGHCVNECKTGDINLAWELLKSAKKLIHACMDVTLEPEALSDLKRLKGELDNAHKMLLLRVAASWDGLAFRD